MSINPIIDCAFAIDHPEHGPAIANHHKGTRRIWDLELESGGSMRIEADRGEISAWTNARYEREQEEGRYPKTISIGPAPELIEKAFAYFGIELGRALSIRPDGKFTVNPDAPDFPELLSKLTGQIVADYAVAEMVLPSNVSALRVALGAVQTAESTSRGIVRDSTREALDDAQERLESVIGNLDGLMGGHKSADK